MNRNGFTIIESMITMAILCTVAVFAYQLHTPIMSFFQRSQAHMQTNMNARTSLETMTHAIQEGRAASAVISTPAGSAVPNSRIDFVLASPLPSNTFAYAFYLANRTLQMQEFKTPGLGLPTPSPQTLSDSVSGLIFSSDSGDPSVVYVTLRIDPPATAAGGAVSTWQVLNQEIHMAVNP